MSRKNRIDPPDSWHHVTNRGLAQRPVFESRADVRHFLACVARAVRRRELEVHSFCVMTTHFHLLVCSPNGRLSRALQRIESVFVRRFNRQRGRDGALFRGRFFSRLVETEVERRIVLRYIDHNPVKARMVTLPELYPFGSAFQFAGRRTAPWVATRWIEEEVADLTARGVSSADAYRQTFGPVGDDHEHLIHRRLQRRAAPDPLVDLVGAAPEEVRRWMWRQTLLADGTSRAAPVLGPAGADAACAAARPEAPSWPVSVRAGCAVDGWQLARVYLLRELCGLSFGEIALRVRIAETTARRRASEHAQAMARDALYASRVARIAHTALTDLWRNRL